MKKNYNELKIFPQYFEEVVNGNKRAEVRRNDREFKVGEEWLLREFKKGKYTSRRQSIIITHILTHEDFEGVAEGFVVFSFRLVDEFAKCCVSIDYEAEYHRCVGTMANIHNEREEAKSAIRLLH